MKLKYVGSRQFITVDANHKKILFDKANHFINEIDNKTIIMDLLSTGEFEVIPVFVSKKKALSDKSIKFVEEIIEEVDEDIKEEDTKKDIEIEVERDKIEG